MTADRNAFGLTPEEEGELAREYGNTAAKTPTAAQMTEYRRLGAAVRASRSAADSSETMGAPTVNEPN